MSLSVKQWIWPDHDQDQAVDLACKLGLSPALARLLINRGITDPGQARAFLYPSLEQLHSPWLMLGIKEAVDRLFKALEQGEKIVIHGDYDADGIAASVILVETLRGLGATIDYYLPSRFEEGYGLHVQSLKKIIEDNAALVVTVDCGINAVEEVSYAAANGLDVIITDHHQPLNNLQGAVSVINPRQENCPYPFKELAGAGIAFKLASAVVEKAGGSFPDHLFDLAALGTAADVVPLLGENRVIVFSGLEVLRRQQRVGFRALIDAVSLNEEHLSSTALSFVLAPAINAAGRMGEALPAANLLLENDALKAEILAAQLHQANLLRRSTEQKIMLEADEAAANLLAEEDYKVITLAGENWHHGVIGIVASRLVEKYNRPVCLVALEGDQGRGSARSIPGFDITAALSECSEILERFGGHGQAAGFTIRTGYIGELRECLNRYALLKLDDSHLTPRLYIEAEIEPSEIQLNLTTQLEKLQPFGMANPVPLFGSRQWMVQSWRLVGGGQKHLKLNLKKDGRTLEPIIFSGAFLDQHLEKGRCVDILLKLKNGFYRDKKTLEAEVKDLCYCDNFRSGSFELIDQRNCKDRLARLKDICERTGGQTVVFAATRSRSEKILKGCSIPNPPIIMTNGLIDESIEIPQEHGPVVFFDLPLYAGVLQHIFQKGFKKDPATIYLLYNRDDLKLNRRLMELSLPSEHMLEKIVNILGGAEKAGDSPVFPGSAQTGIDFKPAPSFWERAGNIMTETGLLHAGRLTPEWKEIHKSLPSCLDFSPTFRATKELQQQCEQFQKLLLEAPLEEIASLLHKLTGD